MARKNRNATKGGTTHGYTCHCPRCLKRRPMAAAGNPGHRKNGR